MRGLDTNVIARFLLRDDAAQFRRAERLVAALAADGEAIHLDVIVLCELVWVLRTGYGRERREIADALDALLGAAPFTVDDREAVRTAIDRYRAGRGDFADYLIALRNQRTGCRDTVTFDRKLRPEDGFTTL